MSFAVISSGVGFTFSRISEGRAWIIEQFANVAGLEFGKCVAGNTRAALARAISRCDIADVNKKGGTNEPRKMYNARTHARTPSWALRRVVDILFSRDRALFKPFRVSRSIRLCDVAKPLRERVVLSKCAVERPRLTVDLVSLTIR